jgi:hypothetical protein
VFWTGTAKTGCVGQFKDCFIDASEESIFEGTILPSDIGGSCVAVIRYGDRFLAKIKPCESKAYLACQGSSTVENATIMTYVRFWFFGLYLGHEPLQKSTKSPLLQGDTIVNCL